MARKPTVAISTKMRLCTRRKMMPRVSDDTIGAVERGAQRLDAVRGEEGGEHHAVGQKVGALDGQHIDHLARDRLGDLLGPGVEDEMHGCVGRRPARRGSWPASWRKSETETSAISAVIAR